MIQNKIEKDKQYLTMMGKRVIISQVDVTKPGSELLCDCPVTGLIVDKEEHGDHEQVSHYDEWDEFGGNKNSNNDLVEACPNKRDDMLIDFFLE